MNQLPSIPVMQRAFAKKDPAFDGTFFVAVKTTSIFCRPVCRAKTPRPENVEFYPTAREALRRGYRPCKLCHPLESSHAPKVVQQLLELIERDPSKKISEVDLRQMKIDPSTARRQFRAYCNTTFAAYQRARRMQLALREVKSGESVISAQVGADFESSSGFRSAFAKMFGTPASRAKDVEALIARWIDTPLGRMVAIASDRGIVLLDFTDRKGLKGAIERLQRKATIVPGDHPLLDRLESQLAQYFAGARKSFDLPLAPTGSDFEKRAWEFLQTIPPGETRSYAQEAKAIGSTKAVRAVGRANGMNYISIVIPCHRVIGSNGELTGYGGGLARKRWLLDHEQRMLLSSAAARSSATGSAAAG